MRPFAPAARWAALVVLSLTAATAHAQFLKPADPPPEMKHFEFLVGTWDSRVEFVDREGKVVREMTGEEIGAGDYVIEPIIHGLFLEAGAGSDVARTWYGYLPDEKSYFWAAVDFQGNFDVMHGERVDGKIVLANRESRTWRDGKPIRWRRTYQDIAEDTHTVLMEFSRDEGQSWTLSNRQYFTRAEGAPAKS